MTPEEKRLLEEAVELSRDNNKILHKMRKASRWSMIFTVFYWFIVLGGFAVAYYFVQPYVQFANDTYKHIRSYSPSGQQQGSSYFDFEKWFKEFNAR